MIKGKKRNIRPNLETNLNFSIHNRFDIEVIDAVSGEIKQRAQAEKMSFVMVYGPLYLPLSVFLRTFDMGLGSGTPAATDTSLFTPLGAIVVAIADISMLMIGPTV